MSTIEFLRQFRVGEYAIFDFAASFIGIFLLSPLLSRGCKKIGIIIGRHNWLLLTLPLSILIHVCVGNFTPMTKDFLDLGGHYTLKIIILGLLVAGLWDVKYEKNTRKK
ncbi:hypothetical protein KBB25_02060 [Candidatus Gracilibacteria bacterium]|nr:hypothetical protein [Candidatus Gracilibacteria bacterium]